MKKRLLSAILTACMVLTLLPTAALAATDNFGAFTVTYDGDAPSYTSPTLTLGNGTYTISGTTTSDKIVVSSGAEANITLSGVSIDANGTDAFCAFDMAGATVNLTLVGTNFLKSGKTAAGLRVPSGASLTITAASTGSLGATTSGIYCSGAGIGGSYEEACGTVTINGGTVTATGATADGSPGGAGIGGGGSALSSGSVGGTVTINGGIVTATGATNGAGIGGGGSGGTNGCAGGTVTINGGTVTAIGGSWGGAGIGGSRANYGGAGATVKITGGSVKATGGVNNAAAIGAGASGNSGSSYSSTVKNASNTTVQLYTLTLSDVSSAMAVTGLSLPGNYTYGTTDMKTDTNGVLYVYLPSGKTGAVIATTATGTYAGTIAANAATLSSAYAVSGTVSNGTTGAIVSGLTVNLFETSDSAFASSKGSATTSAGGTYTIYVPAGSYVARVAASGSYAASVSDAVTVSSAAVSGANITLARTAYAGTNAGTPTLASKTDTQVVLGAVTVASQTVEYGKNTSDTTPSAWQDAPTFNGLAANTTYYFFARVKQAGAVEAGGMSSPLTVTTKNAAPAAPTLTFSSISSDSVTITAVTGAEYSKNNGANWQDGNAFTGLSAATQYIFAVRIKETASTAVGTVTSQAQYTSAATPGAGVGYTIDYGAETISITSGYEVSSDVSFASDKLLSNGAALTLGATYYVRKAVDTTTTPNTPASAFASLTVAAKPDAPSAAAYSYDYHNEQIIFASQYEVFTATSGGSAVTSASMSVMPGGTLYIRVKATSSSPASEWTTVTIPARPATTGLSLTASRTDTTITVAAITGAEYSKDGGTTWQSSNEFTELNPNTDYAINIRYAATASSFASTPLGSMTIKTKTAPGAAPSMPSVNAQTYDSITIDTVSDYQYAITTSSTAPATWDAAETANGTKTFSGLSPATQYHVWVRVAETDTAMPSGYISKSVYTAAAVPSAGEGYTINYSAETISITSGYEVSSDSSFASDKIVSNGAAITPGTTYYVRKAADTTTTPNTPASAAVSRTFPARPETPAATGYAETVEGKNDGRISGATEAMEWKAAGGSYAAVTVDQASNGLTGLPDGSYYLRYSAVDSSAFASEAQVIAIEAGHTITVTFDSQDGSAVADITGKAYGDSVTAPADPTRSGFYFAGWYREAACTNAWTFTLDVLTDNLTLFAKWSAIPTYTVTGTIIDDTSHAVEGATVKIMQGVTVFGTTGISDTYGDFEIDNVPPGTYNLVITKGTKTAIVKVEVSGENVAIGNAALPTGNANSVLVVNGGDTPNVVVGGLDGEARAQLAHSTDNVEITLTVEEQVAATAANGNEVAGSVTDAGKQLGILLAIDVSKTVNGTPVPSYSETSGLIDIIIPLPAELRNKATYAVYRYHGAGVDAITETPNTDHEKIVIDRTNWTLTLSAKKFSTYAIGYTNPSPSPVGGGFNSIGSYTITASAGEGGTVSSASASVSSGASHTITITANAGYYISDVLVDGISVGPVESYTFSDVGASHTLSAVFAKITGLPYYIENGKMVFIGFASDASGTMKYIAPEGATVLFRENLKSFADIEGHWASGSIDFVTERELFLGTGGGDFSPQSGMTRAMFATVIGRLYERSYSEILKKDDHAFTDVDYSAYYGVYIDWAAENSIITGIGGELFGPDQEITRQEMAAILYRFAKFLKASPSDSEKAQLNYPDAAEISSWATEAALYCQQTGIITGRSGGNFAPQSTATRAEVSAILQRFIESSVNNS